MKRVLMLGIVGLLVMAGSGCILTNWTKSVYYAVDLNGSGATVNITFMNEDGDLETIDNWTGNWAQSFTVSGSDEEPFLAFVQAETVTSAASYQLEVSIVVDGIQRAYDSSTAVYAQAAAFYLID